MMTNFPFASPSMIFAQTSGVFANTTTATVFFQLLRYVPTVSSVLVPVNGLLPSCRIAYAFLPVFKTNVLIILPATTDLVKSMSSRLMISPSPSSPFVTWSSQRDDDVSSDKALASCCHINSF